MPDSLPPPSAAPQTALEWARFYAALGWSVVPVRRGEKIPAEKWARYQTLPADGPQLLAWFADRPDFGVGLVQGRRAGTIVLDFDGITGAETLADLDARGLPTSCRAYTPGGGVHVVLRHPGAYVPTRKGVLPGMDVRGDGGFIVAAPSIHANGGAYAWDVDCHPEDVPVADCPAWLVDTITGDAPPQPGTPGDVVRVAAAGPLGLAVERVADGREQYMRDTILAVCRDMRDSLGRLPTEAELIEAAWPQYEAHVDLSRPGRGRQEFQAKVRYTLARVEAGRVRGFDEPAQSTRPTGPADAAQPGPAAQPSENDVFPTLSLEDVMALPPPTWLIDKVLTEGGFATLYAPPASYKTFVSLSMALAIAYGDDWMGRTTKQAGVLYIAGEGVRGLGKRIKAWQRRHKRSGVDAPFRLLAHSVNLTDPAQTAKVIKTALAVAEAEGCSIGAVFIDTVARSMAGADENSAQDMGRFVEACGAICREIGCAVVGIHHTGKDVERGARGSNALLGGVDAEIKIERHEGRVTVTITKQKDDDEGEPLQLRVEKVEIGGPLNPLQSLVVVADEGARPLSNGETAAQREARMRAIAEVATMLGPNGQMTTTALISGLGWPAGGRAKERIAALIPFAPDCAEVTTADGVARLWRIRQGEKVTSPIIVRRQDV